MLTLEKKAELERYAKNDFSLLSTNHSNVESKKKYELLDLSQLEGVYKPIEWEWQGWLATGVVTILAANSGEGKSMLALKIAACYTDGDSWPDGTKPTKTGRVVWLDTESFQNVTVERSLAWGLNRSNFLMPRKPGEQGFTDYSLDRKEDREVIRDIVMNENIKLLLIDSLSGSTLRDAKDTSKAMELMKWLSELARDANIPVLVTHHLRKKNITDGPKLTNDRVRDSTVITQMVRFVWMLEPPDENGVKELHVTKSNLDKFPEPLGLTIDEGGITFVAPPVTERKETTVDKAVNFLQVRLAKGAVNATMIFEEARLAGLGETAIRKAKDRLGVETFKEAEKHGRWFWQLKDAL